MELDAALAGGLLAVFLGSTVQATAGLGYSGVSHSINENTQKLPAALMLLVLRQLRGMDEPIWGVALVSAHT